MTKVKRFLSAILAAALLVTAFAGCSSKSADGKKLKIVATVFPQYDWIKNITSGVDGIELIMLAGNGADLHSYQPTADDIVTIASCDMFVYVGGESDKWADDVLRQSLNGDMTVVSLLEELGDSVKNEELAEGMQAEDDGEAEDEAPEADEHVWLSLRNAEVLTGRISELLQEKDAANAEAYRKNTDEYVKRLEKLDADYKAVCDSSKHKTLLFGDRFPFRYMTDDYGLKYYAAFAGCSSETEASFETVSFLAGKLKELELPCVMTIENSDNKLAQTIIETAGVSEVGIVALDSLQSVTSSDAQNGADYLKTMEENLTALKTALG